MTDEEYLTAAGWELWVYGNPTLAAGDPGVWADPLSIDRLRKVSLARAVADQRRRDCEGDQDTLF